MTEYFISVNRHSILNTFDSGTKYSLFATCRYCHGPFAKLDVSTYWMSCFQKNFSLDEKRY